MVIGCTGKTREVGNYKGSDKLQATCGKEKRMLRCLGRLLL
jgi:hypothetical protein